MILADLSDTPRDFPRVRDARVYTCARVLYTISYRAHVYKITYRRIPNVGVGVGPVEFQLTDTAAKIRFNSVFGNLTETAARRVLSGGGEKWQSDERGKK